MSYQITEPGPDRPGLDRIGPDLVVLFSVLGFKRSSFPNYASKPLFLYLLLSLPLLYKP